MQLKTHTEWVSCKRMYYRLQTKSHDTSFTEAERRQLRRLATIARNACTQWSLDHIEQEQAS